MRNRIREVRNMKKITQAKLVEDISITIDIRTFLARKFDSVDAVPNSGYIELW